jgi:hypothetical protein
MPITSPGSMSQRLSLFYSYESRAWSNIGESDGPHCFPVSDYIKKDYSSALRIQSTLAIHFVESPTRTIQYFILDLHPPVYIREPPQTLCLGLGFERKNRTKSDLTFNLI